MSPKPSSSEGRPGDLEGLWAEMTRLNNELVNAQRELARSNAELSRLSGERLELLRELRHRDKNTFTAIAGLIALAAESGRGDPGILLELEARVASFAQLYSLLNDSESFTELRLDEYALRVGEALLVGRPELGLETELEELVVSADLASPLGLILAELFTNALKYAHPPGRGGILRLRLRRLEGAAGSGGREDRARLELEDQGPGLPPGLEAGRSRGLGLGLVRGLAGQIDADFVLEPRARGLLARLDFPLKARPRPARS